MSVCPCSSRISTWRRADSTIASGVWPSVFSRSGASEPMLTPTRIGVSALFGQLDDFARLLRVANVAGIQAQLRDARFDRRQRHLVIEVDVGDDRDRRTVDDCRQAGRVGRILDRDADDLAAFHRQAVDLLERLVGVGRIGGRHRLHGDRMIAADPNAPSRRTCRSCSRERPASICAAGESYELKYSLAADDARDVVEGDGKHQRHQRREAGDVHQRFFFGIDRLAAQQLGDDETPRVRRRAPESASRLKIPSANEIVAASWKYGPQPKSPDRPRPARSMPIRPLSCGPRSIGCVTRSPEAPICPTV